ncbi:phage portal protein (plasmid) [Cytobacillus spongiae]|uniref:phage portal protein n=1 Tax=Cytobacillus spongiae TaxID=2901381 RepID=UPI001F212A6D|nr:phage portal protein [Cytobacillus spongiae]UII58112.1 phage portal protein [Cytobacillus spongiae]
MVIGLIETILNRNKEIAFSFDLELFEQQSQRAHMKRLAIDTCIAFLGRTISQSEFRVKDGSNLIKDELYYRLNVRPNKNMTSSTFWETFVHKLVYDNEGLIIQADDGDLLIADDFEHNEYAVYEDTFTNVMVKDFTFKRLFPQSKVIHLRYRNERLSPLIDSIFADYGDLFGKLLNSHKRKNQLRGTVDIESNKAKDDETMAKLQSYINKMYKAFSENDIAIVPQQPGFKYNETSSNKGSTSGLSVDEINKVTDGFLNQVAMALGIPLTLISGSMADVEKHTKNYMKFTVNPLTKKLQDESNVKFFTMDEYLAGKRIEIKTMSYQSIFELATSIDKLVSSGAFTGNEMRLEAGYEKSADPKLDKHYITKNYQEMDTDEGGENK